MKLLIIFCLFSLLFSFNAQAGLARYCVVERITDCHQLEDLEHERTTEAQQLGSQAQSCTENCTTQPITERATCLQECVHLDSQSKIVGECAQKVRDQRMQNCAFSQNSNSPLKFLCQL